MKILGSIKQACFASLSATVRTGAGGKLLVIKTIFWAKMRMGFLHFITLAKRCFISKKV